ncbi:hypothetical protein AX17_002240 [Amanita inopinata Kibby_2008]|nr:hypothetical protein AX17_002240 [Amanita inopinata Kibby_2008]
MSVIDDWGMFQVSSPLTLATPTSSQEDRKIGYLFKGSSPNTEPPSIEVLESTKIDVVQIPRSRRVGGAHTQASITDGNSFASFLRGLLPECRWPDADHDLDKPLPECTSSIVGEASLSGIQEFVISLDKLDADAEICQLYATVNPRDLLLNETLDEKNMMLMEVPVLPPPNCHSPGSLFLPTKYMDFHARSITKESDQVYQFLKKVKGIQPLRLSLTWTAFTTNEPLPTHVQISGTSILLTEQDLINNGIVSAAVERLTRRAIASDSSDNPDKAQILGTRCPNGDCGDNHIMVHGCDIMLTRRERQRQARATRSEIHSETEAQKSNDDAEAPSSSSAVDDDERPTKRIKHPKTQKRDSGTCNGIISSGHTFGVNRLDNEVQVTDMCQTSRNEIGPDTQQLVPKPTQPVNLNERTMQDCAGAGDDRVDFMNTPDNGPIQGNKTSTALPGRLTGKVRKPGLDYHALCPDAAWHESHVTAFARLRAKAVSEPRLHTEVSPDELEEEPDEVRNVPADIFNHTTLQLPQGLDLPNSVHRYMTSIDVLQKQALVRALRNPECSVDLVERDTLGGVDLIIDPFTAVVYASLFPLPSQCEELIGRIAKLSWSYQRLVIILEAYPPGCANKPSHDGRGTLYAYTPPILKAIKKLRRGVDMAEAVQEKRETTLVLYAFPNSVQEAASLTRYIGDMAEAADQTKGALWGDRAWLDVEINEDEENLSTATGMNRFIAAVILCQVTFDDFITMTAEARLERFGLYVGAEAISLFNADLEQRLEVMRSSDHPIDLEEVHKYY